MVCTPVSIVVIYDIFILSIFISIHFFFGQLIGSVWITNYYILNINHTSFLCVRCDQLCLLNISDNCLLTLLIDCNSHTVSFGQQQIIALQTHTHNNNKKNLCNLGHISNGGFRKMFPSTLTFDKEIQFDSMCDEIVWTIKKIPKLKIMCNWMNFFLLEKKNERKKT